MIDEKSVYVRRYTRIRLDRKERVRHHYRRPPKV
jgi:hypothetical protein